MKEVLTTTRNEQAQYYAVLSIRKIFINHSRSLPFATKSEFRDFFLQLLISDQLPPNTLKAVMQGLAEIMILKWIEDSSNNQVEFKTVAAMSERNLIQVLSTYESIVNEVNEGTIKLITRSKRTKFKDNFMCEILAFAFTTLNNLVASYKNEATPLLSSVLSLIHTCFSFNFIEPEEDTEYNQIPITWSYIILDKKLIKPIFEIASGNFNEQLKVLALRIAGPLSGIQSYFFIDSKARRKYYKHIFPFIFSILNKVNINLYKELLNFFYNFSVYLLVDY